VKGPAVIKIGGSLAAKPETLREVGAAVARWAGSVPLVIQPSTRCAWAMKPSLGSSANSLAHPADIVTIASHVIGSSVTQAYRAFPILMITVVPTQRATVASS